jgi:hypothetical protein
MNRLRINRIPALSPTQLKGALFMKPMAFLLALTLMPKAPVLRSVSLAPTASAITICSPGKENILQNPCHPIFETEGVNAYLTAHQIPLADAPLIYQYGRSDLRSELRAFLFMRMLNVIHKPAAERTSSEQFMYDWFLGKVWDAEKAYHQSAWDDATSWLNNACDWRPDPDVVKQYGLKYDPTPFCAGTLKSLFFFPPVPAQSYFLTAALKRTYGKLGNDPAGPQILAETNGNLAMVAGIAIGAAAAGAVTVGALLGATGALAVIFPFSVGFSGALAGAVLFAGPAAIVLIAVLCAVFAAFRVADDEKALKEFYQLSTFNENARSNAPDLATMAQDSVGLLKLSAVFVEATMPEFSSAAALPAHRASDPRFLVSSQDRESLTYQDWNGKVWSAATYGGWFVQNCVSASCNRTSFSPTLQYVDWDGMKRKATRIGGRFSVTLGQKKAGAEPCDGDPATGLTDAGSAANCLVFATETLHLKDGNGTNVTVKLNQPPSFTSADSVAFTNGTPRSFQITTASIPAAAIVNSSVVPAGFTFQSSGGSATLTYNGSVPAAQFTLNLTAGNGSGMAGQSLSVVVASVASINWKGEPNLTFEKGKLVSHTITTTGTTPVITAEGLTADYTLTDHHNGTATLSAKLPVGMLGGFRLPEPCNSPLGAVGIRARNAVSDVFEPLCIKTTEPSPIQIHAPASISFNPLVVNSYVIGATGGGPPIRVLVCDAPPWISISEANGSTTISGRPSAFQTQPVNLRLWANYHTGPQTCGSEFASGFLGTKQNLTVNMVKIPTFLTGTTATFEVGKDGTFSAKSNLLQMSMVGELPAGLSSQPRGSGAGGELFLFGTPEPGTSGVYRIRVEARDGSLFGSQDLQLVILEPGKLIPPPRSALLGLNLITLIQGAPSNYRLLTSGFPKMPSFGSPGMSIVKVPFTPNLPGGVSLTQIVEKGQATGEWMLTGTPTTVGFYTPVISIGSSVGSAQAIPIFIRVIRPGDVNGSGTVDCADATLVRSYLGKRLGQQSYEPLADINNDSVIDVRDLAAVSSKLPTGTRCN